MKEEIDASSIKKHKKASACDLSRGISVLQYGITCTGWMEVQARSYHFEHSLDCNCKLILLYDFPFYKIPGYIAVLSWTYVKSRLAPTVLCRFNLVIMHDSGDRI